MALQALAIQCDRWGPLESELTRLGYRELAVRYGLGSLMHGGHLQYTSDGNLASTVDGDLMLGNRQHNALHRLVVRWQFDAPMLKILFDFVTGS